MPDGADQLFRYRADIHRNREIFLIQRQYAFHAFAGVIDYFDSIGRRVQNGRDANGKSHIGLLPFILLAQRQAMNAFELLSSHRSYDAWLSFRPSLECVLMCGKWVDDPKNAELWSQRKERKDEYSKSFSGKKFRSKSLPRSDELQTVLSLLNDEFVHANNDYYQRHMSLERINESELFLKVDFIDINADSEAHTLAFLHLVVVMLDSLDSMFASLFVGAPPCRRMTDALEKTLGKQATLAVSLAQEHQRTLKDLGLWHITAA